MKALLILVAFVAIIYFLYRHWSPAAEAVELPPLAAEVPASQPDAVTIAVGDPRIAGAVRRMFDVWKRNKEDGFYSEQALRSVGRREFPAIIRAMHEHGLYSDRALEQVLMVALAQVRSDSERRVVVNGLLSMRP